jgi:hypothetical protein
MRLPVLHTESLSRLTPGGSGPHHRLRSPALADVPLQHPSSWAGLANLLRTTGSDTRRPSAAARGWGASGTSACRLMSGMSLLPRRPQERLRTRPGLTCLVCVEQEGLRVHKPNQVGGVQIPLHLDAAVLAGVHAHRERFLLLFATLTSLGQLGGAGGHGDDLAASTCSQAGQDLHKLPWRTPLHAPTKATLPRPVGDLLKQEGTALPHDLMRQTAMQALAIRRALSAVAPHRQTWASVGVGRRLRSSQSVPPCQWNSPMLAYWVLLPPMATMTVGQQCETRGSAWTWSGGRPFCARRRSAV